VDVFTELTEPRSCSERSAEPLLDRRENRLDDGSLTVNFVVEASIVCSIKRRKFPVFDHRSHVLRPKKFTKFG
jgi:hypothetical protein